MPESHIADSGERRTYKTGAQRDRGVGKGKPSWIPMQGIIEVSVVEEMGALKYDAFNWAKGMNVSDFVDSAIRHLGKYMEHQEEIDGENHMAQAAWNCLHLIDIQRRIEAGELPRELEDRRPKELCPGFGKNGRPIKPFKDPEKQPLQTVRDVEDENIIKGLRMRTTQAELESKIIREDLQDACDSVSETWQKQRELDRRKS